MKVKKITKPELEGDTYLIAQAVNHNAELLEDLLDRIDKLEKVKPCKEWQEMTREEAINLLDNLIGMVEDNHDSDYDIALQMAIKALMQEPILENALNRIKELEKDKHCKEGQLNELGYSCGEKIEPCNKVRAEIEAQEKWLAEAGYNAYNVGVAFFAIKRALEK